MPVNKSPLESKNLSDNGNKKYTYSNPANV